MAFRRVSQRLARDFWVVPSEATIRRWCRAFTAGVSMDQDYQAWVVSEFSGILCMDEVYQHDLALLLAVDPAAPEGDRLVGYQLAHGSVDAATVETFLQRLASWGIVPAEVITDGSRLYPAVIAAVWPQAAHQLCLFHETRRLTKAVQEVISQVRRDLPTAPPAARYGWGGPLRPTPPGDDPADPAVQRWQERQARRAAGIAQVHALAAQQLSERAIARQTGLHRRTVRRWLQQTPRAAPTTVADTTLSGAAPKQRRHQQTSAVLAQVQALHEQGHSYVAIAQQTGIHRVTVSAWLKRARAGAVHAPPDTPTAEALSLPSSGDQECTPPSVPEIVAPPAPWTNWEQVREVREALKAHRFLLLRRPQSLNATERDHVAFLLESPVGDRLGLAQRFLRDWWAIWADEAGTKRSLSDAQERYQAWQTDADFATAAPFKRVQGRISAARFARLSQFLRQPEFEATNNGAERMGRAFRHRQAPHFNLREFTSLDRALQVTAQQRQHAATLQTGPGAARCRRGRQIQVPSSLAA
jgi:transposase